MPLEELTAAELESQRAFDEGADGTAPVLPAPEPKPAEVVVPKPKYARITLEELADLRAKNAAHEGQFSKAFGTIGNLQKTMNELREQAKAKAPERSIVIPPDAFADMERDFPELAAHFRAGLEATFKRQDSPAPTKDAPDEAAFKRLVDQSAVEREIEALEDAYPDWKVIVGAVDADKEQPNPDNAFRKWLGTKDVTYQAKINGTLSAAILSRAIEAFKNEAKPAPVKAPDPKVDARRQQLNAAMQPKGDGGHAPLANDSEANFAAGFAGR